MWDCVGSPPDVECKCVTNVEIRCRAPHTRPVEACPIDSKRLTFSSLLLIYTCDRCAFQRSVNNCKWREKVNERQTEREGERDISVSMATAFTSQCSIERLSYNSEESY